MNIYHEGMRPCVVNTWHHHLHSLIRHCTNIWGGGGWRWGATLHWPLTEGSLVTNTGFKLKRIFPHFFWYIYKETWVLLKKKKKLLLLSHIHFYIQSKDGYFTQSKEKSTTVLGCNCNNITVIPCNTTSTGAARRPASFEETKLLFPSWLAYNSFGVRCTSAECLNVCSRLTHIICSGCSGGACGWKAGFSVPSGSPAWSPRQTSRRPRYRSPRCCRQPRAPRRGRCGRSRPCRWTCRSGWRISASPPAPVCTSTWAAWAGRNTCRTLAGSGQEGCICPAPEHKQAGDEKLN